MTDRRVIINGDDFGLTHEINLGIIEAYTRGALTSASLMVGGAAVEEAVDLAKQNPGLSVGLHVAFSDTLPLHRLPRSLLTQSNGYFPPDDRLHRAALRSRAGRQQVRQEIAAQFEAYSKTGLPWGHVNSHRHAHEHPLVATMMFREATRWPVKTTRIPYDPPTHIRFRVRSTVLCQLAGMFHLVAPVRSIGRDWTPELVVQLLTTLPNGTHELYFHPGHDLFPRDLGVLLDERVTSLSKRNMRLMQVDG